MLIRLYETSDRAAVRRICCDTADRGEPLENFFPDRELIADLVTRYYTDFEPESSWVADADGQVVGYVNGCLDSRRHRQVMVWRIGPAAVLRAITRGTLWRHETWRLLQGMLRSWWTGGSRRGTWLDSFPAHVHVNIDRAFRGQRAGERLFGEFLTHAKAAGVAGIHASVRGDNQGGCRFFERMGFEAMSRCPMVLPDGEGWLTTETVIYGRKL